MLLIKYNKYQSHAVKYADFAAHAVQASCIHLSYSDAGTPC